MFESEPRVVPVECHECSLRTFVRRKESGLENVSFLPLHQIAGTRLLSHARV
jgi:hypothetical protein